MKCHTDRVKACGRRDGELENTCLRCRHSRFKNGGLYCEKKCREVNEDGRCGEWRADKCH